MRSKVNDHPSSLNIKIYTMIRIEGTERDALILQIQRRIESDTQVVGAPERTAVWERGWAESLERFRKNPVADSLIPAFIHIENPVRWKQDYWMPDDALNELKHVRKMQRVIGNYLKDCENVVEFGCGTGFNLVALGERYPEREFMGLDFSPSACELAGYAGDTLGLYIDTAPFDMNAPSNIEINKGWGMFTFGSIEQLAGRFHNLMEYMLSMQPKMVVHVEPIIELYDANNFVDSLAIAFHRKRGYTEGLLPWLRDDPRVNLIHVERTYFGSLMLEGYNLIVWRPK